MQQAGFPFSSSTIYECVHCAFCLFANAFIPPFWSFCEGQRVVSSRGSDSVKRGTHGRKELVEEAALKVKAVREAHLVGCAVARKRRAISL